MTRVAQKQPKGGCDFHSGEQNELEDITTNIELESIRPIGNRPPKLWRIKTKLKTPWQLMWDHIDFFFMKL
jgi:hypothetical protein